MMNNLKLLSVDGKCFLGISLFSCSSDDSKVEAELIVAKESLSFGNGAEIQKLAIKSVSIGKMPLLNPGAFFPLQKIGYIR
ncbi:MAG: hypothetical protein R2738_01720 [Bacteroides graminisolvens]